MCDSCDSQLSVLYFHSNFNGTKLHITVSGTLITRGWTGFTFTLTLFIVCWQTTALCYRGEKALHSTKEKIKNQKCKHRNHPLGITLHAALYRDLQCSLSHLWMFLSVRPQILTQITTDIFLCNAARKESCWMSYPASTGVCCDALTCCIGWAEHFTHFLLSQDSPESNSLIQDTFTEKVE